MSSDDLLPSANLSFRDDRFHPWIKSPVIDLNEERLLAEESQIGRECGDCTACCTVLALEELQKPMRCACDHVRRAGCGIYEQRPRACREFHCLWLRGVLPADVSYRPDFLGVLFDAYRPSAATPPSGSNGQPKGKGLRIVALEVWTGAFESAVAQTAVAAIAHEHPLELSRRDGAWQTRSPAISLPTGSNESS